FHGEERSRTERRGKAYGAHGIAVLPAAARNDRVRLLWRGDGLFTDRSDPARAGSGCARRDRGRRRAARWRDRPRERILPGRQGGVRGGRGGLRGTWPDSE